MHHPKGVSTIPLTYPKGDIPESVLNPFGLHNDDAYRRWRERKLSARPQGASPKLIELKDVRALSASELTELKTACRDANMAIYACRRAVDEDAIRALGRQLGLLRLDRTLCAGEDPVASIRVIPDGPSQEYIPYTNRPINWHTDGYYNPPGDQIRGVIMHCVRPAAEGGANLLLDPEIVYIRLRDENPDYIAQLGQADAMTIPANVQAGRVLRPDRAGPVFSLTPSLFLHMRYTARKRFVIWNPELLAKGVVRHIDKLLGKPDPYQVRVRLEPGQGILCNNVLHTREGFSDHPRTEKQRLLLRARYHERIAEEVGPSALSTTV